MKEHSVAPNILILAGPRRFSRSISKQLGKSRGDGAGIFWQLERINVVIMDICQLRGGNALLNTIKEILPEASTVVTVPPEERNLAFTEEVINAGATMVAVKSDHKLFSMFVSALL
ncbi:hypothetical protein OROGR_015611 [Orobanche gracilis]